MKQIKVELVDHMGTDLSVVNSARVSFDKESALNETGGLKPSDVGLISYLASHKHTTPFRHNAIQLRCHAPIFLARQLGKHQAGLSWNEVSRRYVSSEPEFYIPDRWRLKPKGSIKQGSSLEEYLEEADIDSKHFNTMCLAAYNSLLDLDIAPEMARMVLPQSMMTSWYWTGNLLSFAHVYKERIAEGAQEEAKHFARELDAIIRPLFPVSWCALVGDGK